MRRQLLPPARRRIKVIVNDRITAYIQSLDAGNGPLLDSIEEEALADCVPIIRRETSAFLETLIASKRPQSILEVGTTGLFGFTDEPCDAGKLPDHDD